MMWKVAAWSFASLKIVKFTASVFMMGELDMLSVATFTLRSDEVVADIIYKLLRSVISFKSKFL